MHGSASLGLTLQAFVEGAERCPPACVTRTPTHCTVWGARNVVIEEGEQWEFGVPQLAISVGMLLSDTEMTGVFRARPACYSIGKFEWIVALWSLSRQRKSTRFSENLLFGPRVALLCVLRPGTELMTMQITPRVVNGCYAPCTT